MRKDEYIATRELENVQVSPEFNVVYGTSGRGKNEELVFYRTLAY